MIRKYSKLLHSILVVSLALSFIFIMPEWLPVNDVADAKSARKKDVAPDFELKDLQGRKFKLSEQRGKRPVLLMFTTTWCPWCVEKIPDLKEIHATYSKKGLVMVNIDIQESQHKVSRFADRHKLPYPVLLDETAEVAERYGVQGVPTMVLIDRKGITVCRQCSYDVEPLLDKMLNRKR